MKAIISVLLAGAEGRQLTLLRKGLAAYGFRVAQATTNAEVWRALMLDNFNAVVLQSNGPSHDFDAWRLLSELGAVDHVAVIFLTRPGRNQNRARAFQLGARSCLTLPASAAELKGCIEASVRSQSRAVRRTRDSDGNNYEDGEIKIDFVNLQIRRRHRRYSMTARESPLLRCLVQERGRFTPVDALCKNAWGPKAWPSKRALLKIYICQLRRKIERNVRHPQYIVSRRGQGYAFLPQPTD